MARFFGAAVLLIALLVVGRPVPASAVVSSHFAAPVGERWFSIVMHDEQVGFVRQGIVPTPDGYRIESDSSVKMLVLGFSREASAHETYQVAKDLSLRSFQVEQRIDGSPMKLNGELGTRGVRVTVETGGGRKTHLLKAKGCVYPPPVLNLLPLLKGFSVGREYPVQMLDVEAVKIKKVAIEAIGKEKLLGENQAFHLRNDLYPFVSNDIWVDPEGRTIKESVRDGLVLTQVADEATVRRFLLGAAMARKTLALDFCLVKTERSIDQPAAVKALTVRLTGVPAETTIPGGAGQTVIRSADGSLEISVVRPEPDLMKSEQTVSADKPLPQSTTDSTPADDTRFRELAQQVMGEAKEPLSVVERLNHWVAENVADGTVDSRSPLETLESRKGNCQARVGLYAALARAAGIPTRVVAGLVYLPKQGFLYHSWAESFVGGWVAVDPTLGQLPADATHLKLVDGDGPDEMAFLAGLMGNIRADIVKMVE